MAKPLDPKAIEAERQTSSRAERREQKRRQMQDEISYNQRGNGVIIPPQKRRELAEEPSETPCCGVLPRQHTGGTAGRQLRYADSPFYQED